MQAVTSVNQSSTKPVMWTALSRDIAVKSKESVRVVIGLLLISQLNS